MSEYADNAIAVIGMACNFPGASSLEEYWALLTEGRCAVTEVGKDRWDNDSLYSSELGASGKLATRWAGQIASCDAFDYEFFNLSKAEANNLDPQQLLALETAWRAVEHARIRPSSLAAKNVGVFIGASGNDFENLSTRDRNNITALTATGANTSIIAARISYVLDLKGPCMTINTACSSSLVAIHEACLNIQTGQCDTAIAGGVSLMLRPETTIAVSQAGMMAPDGRCKTFDDSANGYVRGEGCGIVLLKSLRQALACGDRIIGVIQGSAVNHDGRSNGITAPNRFAQEALIRAALERAGIQPNDVRYIETHGTGTKLGDPIEVNAIKTMYGAAAGTGHADDPVCHIGSVKANIGHLEPAAGVAGLIKVLLQIQHRTVTRQIGVADINRYIRLDGGRIRIPLHNIGWTADGPVHCAVSSFSFGGTNAHVIVSSAPQSEALPQEEGGPYLLTVSAKTRSAFGNVVQQYRDRLQAAGAAGPLCAAAAQTREHYSYRKAIVAPDAGQLMQGLENVTGVADAAVCAPGDAPRIAFLFSGQASQYAMMGVHLYRRFAVVRQTVDEANPAFHRQHGFPVQEVLWGLKTELLNLTEYTQPALYVLQVALARLWQSIGIAPSVVLGHSIGEYAAAHIAGVFSFQDGLEMVLARGALMQSHGPDGNMLAIKADRKTVEAALARCAGAYRFAAFNTDSDVVVSGKAEAIGQIARILKDAGISSMVLKGNRPFHSDLMTPMSQAFGQRIQRVAFSEPTIDIIDNVSAGQDERSVHNADYWVRQIVAPVDFAGCLRHAQVENIDAAIEIGPGSTLLGLYAKAGGTRRRTLVPSLSMADKSALTFFKAAGQLYEAAAEIDWAALQNGNGFIDIPGYPFERKKIFDAADPRFAAAPMPGVALPAPVYEVCWQALEAGASGNDAAAAPHADSPLLVFSDGFYCAEDNADAAGSTPSVHYFMSSDFIVKPAGKLGAKDIFSSRKLEQAIRRECAGAASVSVAVCWDFLASINLSSDCSADVAACTYTAVQVILQLIGQYGNVKKIAFLLPAGGGPFVHSSGSRYAGLPGAVRSTQLEVGAVYLKTVTVQSKTPGQLTGPLLDLLRRNASGEFYCDAQGVRQRSLRARSPQPVYASAIRRARAYLITGGTGSIGLSVAEALAHRGAEQIILMSRHGVRSEHDRQRIGRLIADGTDIRVLRCDVADSASADRAFAELTETLLPLAGVFHAAGTVTTRTSADLDGADFSEVQRSKVQGTINLLRNTQAVPLDFFVSFSSISSLWGTAGLAHYASANSYLDAITEQSMQEITPYLTINWGPWSQSHMVPQEAVAAMAQAGIRQMRPDAAISILFGLLDQRARGRFAVCDVDWNRLADLYSLIGADGLFASLAGQDGLRQAGEPVHRVAASAAPIAIRSLDDIKSFARTAIAALLGTPADEIGDDDSLHDLGIDSLLAIEFKKALEAKLGLPLPATIIFDFPSISAIAGFALSKMTAAEMPASGPSLLPAMQDQDVAIIGISCRFPGNVDTLDAFWELLAGKEDVIADTHARWNSDLFAPDAAMGAERARHFGAGLLADIETFDTRLFGISPVEAAHMDPQQRIGLELAWRCFESAGYRPSAINGKNVGIYVGVATNEYSKICRAQSQGNEYLATGNALNVIAGRIAYQFGLKGPAIAIDTACSSSLVAIHQAVRALRSGDCEMALAAGINVMLDYDTFLSLDQAKMLSPQRRCATFDERADGYVRSEGGGMLLLKSLSMAERDGDRILAVIKGTAVNQDGRSASLTAPNGGSQEAVIRAALQDARLLPDAIDWIEAHGTGTPLGDPIEVQALDRVYGVGNAPLVVGAVKSNIGHLESASGMAGMMKVMASLLRNAIPPNMHFQSINKNLYQLTSTLTVPTEPFPWLSGSTGRTRTAAVSAFGFSGTNAHVLIQDYPKKPSLPARDAEAQSSPPYLLALSGASRDALGRIVGAAAQLPESALAGLCAQAATLRDHHRYRQAFVARDAADLASMLQAAARIDVAKCRKNRRALFVIGSDDALLSHACTLLYDGNDVFKTIFDALIERLPLPLRDGMTPDAAGRDVPRKRMAIRSFLIQCAWQEMWRAFGVAVADIVFIHASRVLRSHADGTASFEACIEQLRSERAGDAAIGPDDHAAVRRFGADGGAIVLSVGVHDLSPLRMDAASAHGLQWFDAAAASRAGNPFHDALCALYEDGVEIVWERVYPQDARGQDMCCPAYPFDRKRHWVTPARDADAGAAAARPPVQVHRAMPEHAATDPVLRAIFNHTVAMHEQIDSFLQSGAR